MATNQPTALRFSAFRPTWEVGASLGVHMLVAAALIVGEVWSRPEDKPLIDPTTIMMVQSVALPKQTSRMPDRPTRTPDPPKVAAPEASPTPPPPPTASDLVLRKDDAPKPAGDPEASPDRTQDREELLRQAQKAQALKDMSAAIGDVDRTRTDPNGVNPEDAILGAGNGPPMDKELAGWWKKAQPAIWQNWSPLPAITQAHPEYVTIVLVKISATGALLEPEVQRKSGDASYDRSAVLAVIKTGSVLPPPAKFAEEWATDGLSIAFPAKDHP